MNAERGKNSYPILNDSPENIHSMNIIHSEFVVFKHMHAYTHASYTYMHEISINEKN